MNKEQAYKKISELVERFGEQLPSYKRSEYNETLTRRDFIDPFFKALGWDVDNSYGNAEAYREVIHEDKIKIGGATKAPDYSFRLSGGKRLFFVEAKKPSVAVKDDIIPAYQIRRYGWSAKLPISIITDFEEFSVYDCTKKPTPTDKASTARIKYLTFDKYQTEFDFLWNTFSKEKVLKGSFDRYIASDTNKKGTTTVDKEFLQSLDNWRTLIAIDICKKNKELDEDEINFAVQQTIDRLIFLRIAEDRSVEPYGQLKHSIVHGNYYENLYKQFQNADDKYNSGLFDLKKDQISKVLVVDNKIIKTIINDLYYPQSPYEFSVLSVEILGSVYEQFLGKQIKIDASHKATIELKPEVRRAGGVYYTPQYIVDYIVQNTIGKLIENKTPKEVSKIKIIDPACGSGSFLIGAYQYLLTWHKDYYNENIKTLPKKNNPLTPDGNLTTAIKKKILIDNIFGVDIDINAVEVTKLSLLLKCLEGETSASISYQLSFFNERILPTLENNIKSGNSLIDTDFYSAEIDFGEEKKVKPFNWQSKFPDIFNEGGFDVVIGNPPYDVLEKDRLGDAIPHLALQRYILFNNSYKPALGGKLNLYRFFVVKALQLAKIKGHVGLIVPSSLLADKSCGITRLHLLTTTEELQFDCFPQKDIPSKRIFEDAKLSTTIFFGKKVENQNIKKSAFNIRTYPANSFSDKHKTSFIRLNELQAIDENIPIPLIDNENWQILKKIHTEKGVNNLGKIEDFIIRRGEINQTVYRKYIEENNSGNERLIKGVQIGKFKFNRKLSQGKVEWFNEKMFLKSNAEKQFVKFERIATQRITGVDEKLRIVATLIKPDAYFADSTNSIHLSANAKYDLRYLLGLLNSKLYQWRFKLTSTNNNVGTNELEALPFKLIDLNKDSETKNYRDIIKSVEELLKLKEQIQDQSLESKKIQIQDRIDYYENTINKLVYSIFEIPDNEIKLIEEKFEITSK